MPIKPENKKQISGELEGHQKRMTKEEILDYFSDLNVVYNNPNRLDDLRKMLDKICEKKKAEWFNPVYDWHQCSGCGYTTSALSRFCPGCGAEMEVEK